MTREELEKRTIERAIGYLEKAVGRCRKETLDRWSLEPPLQFLEMRAKEQWPFEEFRQALEGDGSSEGWQVEGRYQMLNASLNGIKLAVQELLK